MCIFWLNLIFLYVLQLDQLQIKSGILTPAGDHSIKSQLKPINLSRFSQNVSELQSQLNECNRKIADLNDRNQHLHMEIGDYQSGIRTLQGQVTMANYLT